MPDAYARRGMLARRWRVTIEEPFDTPSSVIAYGRRDGRAVVLKVVKVRNDEWRSGEVLSAFGGRGVVRVLEYVEGAVLLERLEPGTPLAELACRGGDDEATEILAGIIGSMAPGEPPAACPTVADLGRGFTQYLASEDAQIPSSTVRRAANVHAELCASQRSTRLLHGDLQHYNIVRDRERGWLAIDPKGVIGELEYEIGAALRNPYERPDVFADATTIENRLAVLSSRLSLDVGRITRWAYAQAVLSMIWGVEDGHVIAAAHPMFSLVAALEPMLQTGSE